MGGKDRLSKWNFLHQSPICCWHKQKGMLSSQAPNRRAIARAQSLFVVVVARAKPTHGLRAISAGALSYHPLRKQGQGQDRVCPKCNQGRPECCRARTHYWLFKRKNWFPVAALLVT